MFTNVLIGVDGRPGGRDAIALARRLAAPGAHFTLGHVYGAGLAGGRGAAMAIPYEHQQSKEMLAGELAASGLDAQLCSVGHFSPGRGLHELAEARRADLLVVGSCSRALLGRAVMGDDTRSAVNGATCAVAVAPRGYAQAPHELRRFAVGYDGTVESELALEAARALAARDGGEICAVRVVSLQDVREEAPIPADWPGATDALVSEVSDALAAELPGIETRVIYGGPREELARVSTEADLLIVGSRSYGPLARLVHGRVSEYLLRHVGCPLLVLPRPAAVPPQVRTAGIAVAGPGRAM